jgi:predicted ATPase
MPTEPATSTAEFPTSEGFVGRHQELVVLRSALEEALSGRGRLVMLAGEPGIGKTRTAQDLAAYAQTRGAQVLWGRCYEEAGAPPYWPWVQPLRMYVDQAKAERLLLEMGSRAAEIAGILPELREKLPDLGPPAALDPEQARFRLFDSIATFLKNAGQRQPLVLVLDDLHWADRSSLLLLEFIAQELQTIPLLVLGAYRDVGLSSQHPLSQTLGNLIRTDGFVRLQFRGLAQAEVAQLLDITPGWDSSPQTIAASRRSTSGLRETHYSSARFCGG